MTSQSNHLRRCGRVAAIVAAVFFAGSAGSASAQTRAKAPSPNNDRPLTGVRSQGPRIMRPTSTQTLPINRRNTLLPADRSAGRPSTGVGDRTDRHRFRPFIPTDGGHGQIGKRHPGVIVRDGAVIHIGSSGFGAFGRFGDDDSSVVFRVGSGFRTHQPHFGIPKHGHCPPDPCSTRRIGYYNPFWFDWWDDDYYAPSLIYAGYADPFVTSGQTYAQQMSAQQAAAAAAQPPQLRELELADLSLASGDAPEAVRRYQAYLATHTQTPEVIRSLALALFEDGRLQEAVATMAMAYERDPLLAARAIEAGTMAGDGSDMLGRVRQAVRFAHRVDSASAWLTVTVLMQAQEREPVAMKMAERAKDAGLAEPVYREFKVALGG